MKKIVSKSAILFKKDTPLKLINLSLPTLKRGQVLVKVSYTGVCGSQLIEQKGGRPYTDKYLPHMLGHEASGIVLDIGPGVKKVKKMDKVILSWIHGKGIDSGGLKINHKGNKINGGPLTTFNTHSIVSENRVFKKPTYLTMRDAALYGCVIPTGAGMILNQLKEKKKDRVVFLFGLGGVGLAAYLTLYNLGYKKLFVIEKNISSCKMNIIKKLKINLIQNKDWQKFKKNFKNKYKDKKSIFIDTTGDINILQFCVDQMSLSGIFLFASHPMDQKKLFIKPIDILNEKKIIGSRGGKCNQDIDIKKISMFFKTNKISYKIFHDNKNYKLSQINSAFRDLKKGNVIRPIIKL